MNSNSQFSLNQLQNFTSQQQSLASRLLNYNSQSSVSAATAAAAAAAAANMNALAMKSTNLAGPSTQSKLSMQLGLGQPQQQQQQQQLKTSLFDNFSLNQNFSNNFTNLSYTLNLQQQQQQQQHQHHQQSSYNSNIGQKLGAVANSLASSLVGLSNLNQASYAQQATTCNLNNTLFVGNLHASLQEIDLIQVFRPFGRIVECCKKWLHFGFVKFTTEEEACHAYVTLNGFRLKGRPMRLEFQNRTKKARIKAILAQAALQAATTSYPMSNDVQLGYSNLMNSDEANNQLNQQLKNASLFHNANNAADAATYAAFYKNIQEPATTVDAANNFFNPDQLIKFAKSGDGEMESVSSSSSSSSSSVSSSTKEINAYSNFNIEIERNSICDFKELLSEKTADDFKEIQHLKKKEQKLSNSSEEIILTLTKKTLSPSSNSPHYDCLSVSSDSGCRSASFLNDEDSAIASLKSIEHFSRHLKLKENETNKSSRGTSSGSGELKIESDLTISEHCEYTCSNSSPVKEDNKECIGLDLVDIENDEDDDDDDDCDSNCDTSDDASEIPTDSDCLNDLDLIEEFPLESDCASSSNGSNSGINSTSDDYVELNRYNQVIEKDGTMVRKKLEYGIYRSINQTLSLFIEPNDILKQMDASEYEEYNLFPNDVSAAALVDSYLLSKHPFYLF
jgi:hypothetical protein